VGTRRLAEANVYKLLDIEYATAAENQAVGYAEAESAFWVGKFGLAEGASDAALAHTRDLAKADADLDYATTRADAYLVWVAGKPAVPPSPEDPDGEPAVAGIVAGDWEIAEGRATGWRNLQVSLADIARDTRLGCLPHIETQTNSYAAAQVAFWSAEVAATSARNTAEANALANFRTADYAQTVTAIAGIHTAIDLPWTDYQADLAAALSTWWIGSEKANFLGLAGAVNAAETAFQTTVNAAFLDWTSDTAASERAYVTAQANADYNRAERDLDADEDYLRELAGLDESYQIDWMTAQRTHAIGLATAARNFVDTGDAPARDAANAAAETTFANSRRNATQQYTIDEAEAYGDLATIRAGSDCTRVGQSNTAVLTYVTSTSGADEANTSAEANAQYARLAAIALAEKNYDLAKRSRWKTCWKPWPRPAARRGPLTTQPSPPPMRSSQTPSRRPATTCWSARPTPTATTKSPSHSPRPPSAPPSKPTPPPTAPPLPTPTKTALSPKSWPTSVSPRISPSTS
jgi:hypothetical protein